MLIESFFRVCTSTVGILFGHKMELLYCFVFSRKVINVHLLEIVSFTSGRVPLAIWYPGPFPYTAVVKRLLSLASERDTPVKHKTKWYVQTWNIRGDSSLIYFLECSLPKTGFPLAEYPPKAKTWEWSAVTTLRVSSSLVSSAARPIARSNSTASWRAFLAFPPWWAWSILPLNVQKKKYLTNKQN